MTTPLNKYIFADLCVSFTHFFFFSALDASELYAVESSIDVSLARLLRLIFEFLLFVLVFFLRRFSSSAIPSLSELLSGFIDIILRLPRLFLAVAATTGIFSLVN